jgi:hypothetical protein
MTKQGARDWIDGLTKVIARAAQAVEEGFTWNGRAVSVKGLRRRMAEALGGGFVAE